ncbi:MAG: TonB-dependent receptor [Bryobacteraceae bacterium]|nr:TonB-dependent receptor [Bryobacteraceae bacterium]
MLRDFRVACLAVLFVGASVCQAQEVRASISGIVSDSSGAAVAGAKISIVNTSNNAAFATESNETGNFVAPLLQPGSYTLSVEHPGFKKYLRDGIVLQVLDKARLDVELTVGSVGDSVTVSSSVSALQTETASRGQSISNELVSNLPTQGRNPFQIAWATPGVTKVGSWRYLRSFDSGGTSGFSINGGKNQENEVLLDGISNTQSSRSVISVPTMESIQEFKVLTNTYDAQYGRTGGGVVIFVTKSGTNDFHGTLFENFQNSKLNANQTELNSAGRAKPPNNINSYGAAFDGPVRIPKLFDGRNKLFWLVSWEAMKQRSADPGVVTVPTMPMRTGDFSGLFNAQGQQVLIYDPLTTVANGSRQPFPGNRIPEARISQIAKSVFSYYPAPTAAGTGPALINNYPFPSRWVGDLDQWIGRLDYQISSKNKASFRYGQNPYSEYRGLTFVLDLASENNPAEPTGNAPLRRNGRSFTWNWTSTISPSMTFDLRAGLNRWENAGGNSFGAGFDPRKLGFSDQLVNQFGALQFPPFSLGSYQQAGSSVINFGMNDAYSVQPNLSMVVGRHFIKFGAEGRKYNDNQINPGNASGNYAFGKNWTQSAAATPNATSGNEVATFLLGYPTSASVDRNINPAITHFYYATFFQDDWKVTQRLTLNLGFRWDYETPSYERYNRMLNGLDFDAASPIASRVSGLSLKGAVLFAGVDGQPREAFTPDRNNFGPRLGAAWRLSDKWVMRGGYGLSYLGTSQVGSSQGFSQTTSAITTVDNLTPSVTMVNPFALLPNRQLIAPLGASQGAASFLGQGVAAQWRDRALPYSQQYSVDIQREFRGNVLVEVGYVGNRTSRLPLLGAGLGQGIPLNVIPTPQLNQLTPAGAVNLPYYTQQVANPLAGLIPNNAALNGATTSAQNLMYPYPQYSGVTLNFVPIGKQRYSALQTKVSKRFSDGMVFIGSYSYSRTMQQVRMLNTQDFNMKSPDSTPLVDEPADQVDLPHKFNLTALYQLPFGKGKPFGGSVSGLVNQVIGGWQLAANVTYMSGPVLAHPNAPQTKAGGAKLDDPTKDQWFDTSLWKDSAGRLVAAPNLNYTTRNFPYMVSDVRLPGYQNWDASISKYFPIREKVRLQFRFEAVNALNHPWFSGIASVDVTNAQFGRLNPTQGNLPRFLKLGLQLQF